jgi:hypothetical protein
MKAAELPGFGFSQIQVGKNPPNADGEAGNPGVFNFAEPTHEHGADIAPEVVGQVEVERRPGCYLAYRLPQIHQAVTPMQKTTVLT